MINFIKNIFSVKEPNTTMCTYCGVGCKLEVDVENEKIKGANYPVNKGALCIKGAELLEVSNKNRLEDILVRPKIGFAFQKENDWDKILSYIASKIKQTIPERIAFYSAGQVLLEDYYVANKLFKGFIGTSNIDSNSRTCIAAPVTALTKVFGVDYVPGTMEDVLKTDLLIIAGANPAHGHIVFFEKYIKPAVKKGVKAVIIDPYKTRTAKYIEKEGGLFIQIKPGGDVNLFNAVAKELLNRNVIDIDYVLHNFNGAESYIEKLKNVDVLKELSKADVTEKQFYEFVDLIIKNKKMVTVWSMGFNQSSEGVQKNIAALNLHLLLGRFGQEGSNPFPLTGQTNAMGGREVGALATALAIHDDFSEENRKKIAKFWKTDFKKIPSKKGLTITEIMDSALKGDIDILIIMHTDPVYSLPNRHRIENALKNIPLVIEINAYKNTETSNFVHIRLPAKAWGEKNGRQVNMDRHVSHHRKLIESPYMAKEDWLILCELAKKLGYGNYFNYSNADEIYKEFQELTKLSKEKHLNHFDAKIKDLKKDKEFMWGKDFFKNKKALTANKKPNLIFPENKNLSLEPNDEYPFNLISVRTKNHWNSTTKTIESKKIENKEKTEIVYINPKDAEKLGLIDEDEVKIISPFGDIVSTVVIDHIKEGVVAIPSNDRRINYLTSSIVDPESFQPDYNKVPVKIEKISF